MEVLVLGRQDGLAHDQGHFVVGHHPPVLPRELDHDLSPGVRDLARRGRLEQDEWSELGKVAAVEVDVVDEGDGRREGQGRGEQRGGDAHGPVRPGGPQAPSQDDTHRPQAAGGGRADPPQPPGESSRWPPPACAGSSRPRSQLRRVVGKQDPRVEGDRDALAHSRHLGVIELPGQLLGLSRPCGSRLRTLKTSTTTRHDPAAGGPRLRPTRRPWKLNAQQLRSARPAARQSSTASFLPGSRHEIRRHDRDEAIGTVHASLRRRPSAARANQGSPGSGARTR